MASTFTMEHSEILLKWLDILALCKTLLPKNNIDTIKYFSANVSPRSQDDNVHTRQQIYFRALNTTPKLNIIKGQFSAHPAWMLLLEDPKKFVRVIRTEEKGSDVNLASHLLMDAYRKNFDVAVVISNDSDLFTPIQMVQHQMKLPVGIISPTQKPGKKLSQIASFIKVIREGSLQTSQFPVTLTDKKGKIHKPSNW